MVRQKLYQILAFCISSALGCMNEPPSYGSLRLIEVMEGLIEYDKLQHGKDASLESISFFIGQHKLSCMDDEDEFATNLMEIASMLMDATKNDNKDLYFNGSTKND